MGGEAAVLYNLTLPIYLVYNPQPELGAQI